MINENLANGGLVSNENLIILSNNQKTISSLDLCELINKIRKEEGVRAELQHKDLLKKINEELEEISEKFRSSYIDSMNREKPCYNLPQKEALQVIASESKRVRRRLIDEIERLTNENNQLKNNQPLSYFEMVQKTLLLTQEEIAKRDEIIKIQNSKIEEDKPKVLFAECCQASKNSILINELAKLISQEAVRRGLKNREIGQNRLFEWLRENEYLGKFGGFRNIPNQKYIEMGLFEIKKGTYTDAEGNIVNTTTPKVTAKGQVYFINKFLNKEKDE